MLRNREFAILLRKSLASGGNWFPPLLLKLSPTPDTLEPRLVP